MPLCNSTTNSSCINYTSVSPITTAPMNGIIFVRDGYLYLTNDTLINYTTINNISYYITNITNITYVYNISNGSNLTIIQNITANDSIIRDWVNSKLNSSFLNSSYYIKNETDIKFVFRTELDELKNTLTTYSTKNDLNTRYGYLLAINASSVTGSINLDNLNEDNGFTMVWKVILIIDCVLTVLLMIGLLKMSMDN